MDFYSFSINFAKCFIGLLQYTQLLVCFSDGLCHWNTWTHTHTHTHLCRMCEVKMGGDEQKAELVSDRGFNTKDLFQKRKLGRHKERKKRRSKTAAWTQRRRRRRLKARVNSHIHTHTHNKGTPAPFKRPSVAWNGWVLCVCVFKNISVLILVPPKRAEHRGEEGRRRGRQAWKALLLRPITF